MIDEHYSVVVDYVTKNGKLPTLASPPQVIFAQGAGAAGGMSNTASTIMSAVVASAIGGILGAFSKTKVLAKLPKKKLGVQNATVFRNAEQITVDRRIATQKKELIRDLKASALKNEAITNKNREISIKNEELREKLRQSEVVKQIERQENIENMRKAESLQREKDLNDAYAKMRTPEQSNDILQKSIQRQQMAEMQAQARKERVLTTEQKFSQVPKRSMAEPEPSRESQVTQYLKTPKTLTDVTKDLEVPKVAPLFPKPSRAMSPKEQKETYKKPEDNEEGNRRVSRQNALQELTY